MVPEPDIPSRVHHVTPKWWVTRMAGLPSLIAARYWLVSVEVFGQVWRSRVRPLGVKEPSFHRDIHDHVIVAWGKWPHVVSQSEFIMSMTVYVSRVVRIRTQSRLSRLLAHELWLMHVLFNKVLGGGAPLASSWESARHVTWGLSTRSKRLIKERLLGKR